MTGTEIINDALYDKDAALARLVASHTALQAADITDPGDDHDDLVAALQAAEHAFVTATFVVSDAFEAHSNVTRLRA